LFIHLFTKINNSLNSIKKVHQIVHLRTCHIINYAHLRLYFLIFTIKVANRNSNN